MMTAGDIADEAAVTETKAVLGLDTVSVDH